MKNVIGDRFDAGVGGEVELFFEGESGSAHPDNMRVHLHKGIPADVGKEDALKLAREIQLRFRDHFYGVVTEIRDDPESKDVPDIDKNIIISLNNGQLEFRINSLERAVGNQIEEDYAILIRFNAYPNTPERHQVICWHANLSPGGQYCMFNIFEDEIV
jgi:hypothetical protein